MERLFLLLLAIFILYRLFFLYKLGVFLEKTATLGNVVKGFDRYRGAAPSAPFTVKPQDFIISLSSTTSPASKERSVEYDYLQDRYVP